MNKLSAYSYRITLFLVAGIGAYISLGGRLTWVDFAFAGTCIVANEIRNWGGFERWPKAAFFAWMMVFLQLPTLHFVLRLYPNIFDGMPTELLETEQVLPVAIVSLALPFQIFAAYYASMPRAHHLVLIFALVESVLAIKSGQPQPLWFWLMLLVIASALALAFGNAQDSECDAEKTRAESKKSEAALAIVAGRALLHRGVLPWVSAMVPGFLILMVVIFSVIPTPSVPDDQEPAQEEVVERAAEEAFDPAFDDFYRREASYILTRARADSRVSGLQKEVDLTSFGELKLDEAPFGRIRISTSMRYLPNHVREGAYFRVATHNSFNGRKWSSTATQNRNRSRLFGAQPSLHRHSSIYRGIEPSQLSDFACFVDLELKLAEVNHVGSEGFGLPFPGILARVEEVGLSQEDQREELELAFLNESEEAILYPREKSSAIDAIAFQAYIPWASADDLTSTGYVGELRRPGLYRSLPRGYADQLREWEGIDDLGVKRGDDPIAIAKAVEQWLREDGGYRYSLKYRAVGPDPIISFITNDAQRIGHCEYFASAMVVLLRYFGVESRLAVGFMGEESETRALNDMTYYLRYSNAHAWVEVYAGQHGWLTFDPTTSTSDPEEPTPTPINTSELPPPVESESAETESSIQEKFQLPESPRGAVSMLTDILDEGVDALGGIYRILMAVGGLVLLMVLWSLRRVFSRRLAKRKQKESSLLSQEEQDAIASHLSESQATLFDRFIKACARFQVERLRSQTPREFVGAIHEHVENDLAFLDGTVRAFYELSFAAPNQQRLGDLEQEIVRDIDRLEGLNEG